MEAYLNHFPSTIEVDGVTHRLILTKNYNKNANTDNMIWIVAYEDPHKQWYIWKWNVKLNQALRIMEAWLRQQNLWIEETPTVDFNQLNP